MCNEDPAILGLDPSGEEETLSETWLGRVDAAREENARDKLAADEDDEAVCNAVVPGARDRRSASRPRDFLLSSPEGWRETLAVSVS